MTVPWRRIGSGVVDVLVILAVLAAPLVALFLVQFLMSTVDGWIDGFAGRSTVTDCDPKGCWPR